MIRNKIYALGLIGLGLLTTSIDNDATVLVLYGFIAIPMFFSKTNWID